MFLDIYGSGVSGEYQTPDSNNSDPSDSLDIYFTDLGFDSFTGFNLTAAADSSNLSITAPNDDYLKYVEFTEDNSSFGFDYSSQTYLPPEAYFSDYLGEYDFSDSYGSYFEVENVNGEYAEFSVTTVTITPEPTTMALIGLGGLFIRRKRRA
ncbi:hypothetical protein L21SP3_01386 [Sedimentisphaera cyanobacteriorum]|uniref:Ice-binding protein C-terminal domain-containing protein n=1 Tax=Sedimentisphaera cyanobacteriorum TaxID=1940790 RepID=A0A1Q2HQD9_9BACT|nr:PEP-CTERM sorting domain-containing protein [Sedimentisphaera cyanobacteriorum]AQQ09580.1 hypothetical protein L21SP3_01386 [Sedimentisphaera cyanobacteriorum]